MRSATGNLRSFRDLTGPERADCKGARQADEKRDNTGRVAHVRGSSPVRSRERPIGGVSRTWESPQSRADHRVLYMIRLVLKNERRTRSLHGVPRTASHGGLPSL